MDYKISKSNEIVVNFFYKGLILFVDMISIMAKSLTRFRLLHLFIRMQVLLVYFAWE